MYNTPFSRQTLLEYLSQQKIAAIHDIKNFSEKLFDKKKYPESWKLTPDVIFNLSHISP